MTPLGRLDPRLNFLFSGPWFSATLVSFVTYYLLMRRSALISSRTSEARVGV